MMPRQQPVKHPLAADETPPSEQSTREHPEQHRGISLREAAIFQSFPRDYQLVPEGQQVSSKALSRLIGNAVPPMLGAAVGRALREAPSARRAKEKTRSGSFAHKPIGK